jgi:hypothetical protein
MCQCFRKLRRTQWVSESCLLHFSLTWQPHDSLCHVGPVQAVSLLSPLTIYNPKSSVWKPASSHMVSNSILAAISSVSTAQQCKSFGRSAHSRYCHCINSSVAVQRPSLVPVLHSAGHPVARETVCMLPRSPAVTTTKNGGIVAALWLQQCHYSIITLCNWFDVPS